MYLHWCVYFVQNCIFYLRVNPVAPMLCATSNQNCVQYHVTTESQSELLFSYTHEPADWCKHRTCGIEYSFWMLSVPEFDCQLAWIFCGYCVIIRIYTHSAHCIMTHIDVTQFWIHCIADFTWIVLCVYGPLVPSGPTSEFKLSSSWTSEL